MEKNTISVKAYMVNGDTRDILEDASPKEAIEEYLLPDTRPPVQTLVISVATKDGQIVDLHISQTEVSVHIEHINR